MRNIYIILLVSLLITSCSVEKRLYMPGYSIRKNISDKHNDSKRFVKQETETLQTNKDVFFQNTNQEAPASTASLVETAIEKPYYSIIEDTTKSSLEIFSIFNSVVDSCDELTMKNDSVVRAKILEIDIDKISYKRCVYLSGPTIIVKKSDVKLIKYANGVSQDINSNTKNKKLEIEPFGVNASLISIVGLIIFMFFSWLIGIIFLNAALVLSIIGFIRYSKNKETYRLHPFSFISILFFIASLVLSGIFIKLH